MVCTQCRGIEETFSQKYVDKDLTRYRTRGPDKTTLLLTEAIKAEGVQGATLLDIGGGVGAVQHTLLDAGARLSTDVDASAAYLAAAREETQRRGRADQISYRYGDFVEMAAEVAPADVVTLNRVICCYPDMEKLVSLSAAHARKLYGVVIPRDTWWIKLGLRIGNFFLRLQHSHFRFFVHPTTAIEAIINSYGLQRCSYRRGMFWQVLVFAR
jgi:2-polyprenyl-3-methyl-5-hydroxy-6-metoxy-1,4-benzoquinol methylase